MNVPANEPMSGSSADHGSSSTYRIEAVNGTRLSEFTAVTDFTANNARRHGLRDAVHLAVICARDQLMRVVRRLD